MFSGTRGGSFGEVLRFFDSVSASELEADDEEDDQKSVPKISRVEGVGCSWEAEDRWRTGVWRAIWLGSSE